MLSIWRLQSIVESRAATLPTFDPTWYGPTPIVLSSMEVCLATICASLPVFWPVLKKTLGPYIMVTHEIKVTRQSRQDYEYGDGDTELPRRGPTLEWEDPLRLPSLVEGKSHDTSYQFSVSSPQQEDFGPNSSFRTHCKSGKRMGQGSAV